MPISPAACVALLIALAACVTDIRERRIPNALTFGGAVAALLAHGAARGPSGLAFATEGWLLGALIFIVPFALQGLGAGDVKLVAALGAWLGPHDVVWLAAYAAMAGGVLALAVSLARGYLRQALRNIWLLLSHWTVNGVRPLHEVSLDGSAGPRLAYAVPIFCGTVITLWLH